MKTFIKSRLRKQKETIKNPVTGEIVHKNAYQDTIFDAYINADESFNQFKKDQKLKIEETEKASTKSSALDILKKIKDN